jgi:thymidine kinase
VFKPVQDARYARQRVASHDASRLEAVPIMRRQELLTHLQAGVTDVAIDEAQFLDEKLPEVAGQVAGRGLRVIVAGLDLDFRGEPFGAMPQLMAMAETVDKLQAICMVCGAPASRTQRLVNGHPAQYTDPVILVGAQDVYEARCRLHHIVLGGP